MTEIPLNPRIALAAFLTVSSLLLLYKSRQLKKHRLSQNPKNPKTPQNPKIIFASETGTSKTLAFRLSSLLESNGIHADVIDPKSYEPEDLAKETLVLIVASTWDSGKPSPNGEFLAQWLSESAEDFRVGSLILASCRYVVFGVGSSAYGDTYNKAARDFSRWMKALGAVEVAGIGEGDVDGGDVDAVFDAWSGKVVRVLKGEEVEEEEGDGVVSDAFDGVEDEEDDYEEEEEELEESNAVDMEDIAGKAPLRKLNGEVNNGGLVANGEKDGVKEMVTPVIRASLQKQVFF